jgi:hypothetical protein
VTTHPRPVPASRVIGLIDLIEFHISGNLQRLRRPGLPRGRMAISLTDIQNGRHCGGIRSIVAAWDNPAAFLCNAIFLYCNAT